MSCWQNSSTNFEKGTREGGLGACVRACARARVCVCVCVRACTRAQVCECVRVRAGVALARASGSARMEYIMQNLTKERSLTA